MKGASRRTILKLGRPVDVYNATSGGGGRDMPDYGNTPDGTMRMATEQRGQGRTVTDSSGTEVEADIEFRAVPMDGDPEIIPSGDGQPSLLELPSGKRYRVMETYPEDSGVLVMSTVEY